MRKSKKAIAVLNMVLAAAMFTVSIVTLYSVTTDNTRLGLMCTFIIVLAAVLQFLTNASRTELFAATAAQVNFQIKIDCKFNTRRYAAVLIVFVSGN